MRRIILVDDNADLRISLDAVLRADGYIVRAASQGRQAFELQRAEPADLLLTELARSCAIPKAMRMRNMKAAVFVAPGRRLGLPL